MSQTPAASHPTTPAAVDREASVNAAIDACGGDVRATIWELLTERVHLEHEAERLAGAVSRGYVRWGLVNVMAMKP